MILFVWKKMVACRAQGAQERGKGTRQLCTSPFHQLSLAQAFLSHSRHAQTHGHEQPAVAAQPHAAARCFCSRVVSLGDVTCSMLTSAPQPWYNHDQEHSKQRAVPLMIACLERPTACQSNQWLQVLLYASAAGCMADAGWVCYECACVPEQTWCRSDQRAATAAVKRHWVQHC